MNYIQEFHRQQLHGWLSTVLTNLLATAQLVYKGSGKFGGYFIYNPNSSVAYVQVYDAAAVADVTVGTTPPILRFGIPATAGANLELKRGRNITNGIVIAATTTPTGSSAPSTGLEPTVYWL